jgi:hypothetical protein
MGASFQALRRYLVSLPITMLVVWSLYLAQRQGNLVEEGPFTYPPTYSVTTEHGWPVICICRSEAGERFLPNSKDVRYSVRANGLFVDIAAWCAIVSATAYVSWRVSSCNRQFTLGVLFSLMATTAIVLGWWRWEYESCRVQDRPDITALFVMMSDSPMLRLLRFSPTVFVPVLFGTACLVLCTLVMIGRIMVRGTGIGHITDIRNRA